MLKILAKLFLKSCKKKVKHTKRNIILSLGSITAVVTIFLTVNRMLLLGQNGIVYAMSKAFDEVKTYYGMKIVYILQRKYNIPNKQLSAVTPQIEGVCSTF